MWRSAILAIGLLLISSVGQFSAQSLGGYSAPSIAAVVGFNTLTFNSSFKQSTVDVANTYVSGFSWYVGNFFNAPPSNPITFNANGTATINGSAGNAGVQLTSAALVATQDPTHGWIGTAFGGGAYVSIIMKFDPNVVNTANGWPAFFMQAIEAAAALPGYHWAGQVANYNHAIEVDVIEADLFGMFPGDYGGSLHEVWGIANANTYTNPLGVRTPPAGFDYNTFHEYAVLWIATTGSTKGSLTWFCDGKQIGTANDWTQFTNQSPPPGAGIPWTFGALDTEHMMLMLGSGANQPLIVQSVNVWQSSAANNLVQ